MNRPKPFPVRRYTVMERSLWEQQNREPAPVLFVRRYPDPRTVRLPPPIRLRRRRP
jgi:hypothetical protein